MDAEGPASPQNARRDPLLDDRRSGRSLTVPSYREERQRQGREEHGDDDAEGCGYADTVGQRPQDEGGYQDGPSPADGEPRGGRVAVSRHRGDGCRDTQRVDTADAKSGYEQPGEG